MNYPIISEYVEAIKVAEDNFEVLTDLRPVLDADGEPVMTSGNFAVVFKMKDVQTGKLHAVKCFLKEQEGRAEAYSQIAEELEYVNSTLLTPIKYLDKELFVDTSNSDDSEFPVLLMDWVEGLTLDKYIREHIDDQYELSMLAYQFSRLAMWLMPQPFAHGDLKPDNILVRNDGTLALVDYDGMYVPAMKGQKARELGSPDFRHPSRTEDDFDEHIDDFSLASILLSLKAIALQPGLLEEYGAADRLLFSEKDYRNLPESASFEALRPLIQDTELATLYSQFILASSQNNLSQVSFRLFNLSRPDKSQYEVEILSTKVTDEDLENAWIDEYRVKYSADRKRLLWAPRDIEEYAIRKGTKVVCDEAFFCCIALTSIHIPNSITSIGNSAFSFCKALTSIHIPNSVTSIGNGTFNECEALKSITVDKNNRHYDSRENCNAIIETKSNTLIAGCSKTIIPDSITSIGNSAFDGCRALTSIHIPESVTSIGEMAFYCCEALTAIHIPESVTSIGNKAFSGCTALTAITEDKNNRRYDSRENCNAIIETKSNTLIAGCSKTIIPESVTSIGKGAFYRCDALTSIHIPESVTAIGKMAFYCCEALTSIHIPESVTSIGDKAFGGCTALTAITVDKNNRHYDSRENCNAIIETKRNTLIAGCSKTIIPEGVTSIGDEAFGGCTALTAIHIPESVTSIRKMAFKGCKALTSIFIPIGTRSKFKKLLPGYKDKLVER